VVPTASGNEKSAGKRATLWPSEALVSDIVGRIIEFWGFKRNMGRVWAVLYLSHEPLTAQDLRELLRLSSGAVSMILNELSRWGVVRKVWIQGDRRDHFAAEVQLWRMISRVLSERERTEIVVFMETCEEALRFLETKIGANDAKERARAHLQIERIKALYDLARLGKKLLDGLLSTAKLDAEPLMRFTLGARRS
jgi:DNA-binding transcriptional regulator GbsR (MarR family)